MNEAGRYHLEGMCGTVKLVSAVRNELLKHLEKNHPEARKAMELMNGAASRFVNDRGVAHKVEFADEALRRIAISMSSKGRAVQFLTADMALAEVLSSYPHVMVSYLARYENMQVMDWVKMKTEILLSKAQQNLKDFLVGHDLVLSSSALLSPGIEQFLLNLQQIRPGKQHRPVLHECALNAFRQSGHLPWRVLNLLRDKSLINFNTSSGADYDTEEALLDAFYFARSKGRDVCLLVSPHSELPQNYKPQIYAHMLMAPRDAVTFAYLNPLGEPVGYMQDWHVEVLLAEKSQSAAAEAADAEPAPASEPEPAPAPQPAEPPLKAAEKEQNFDSLIKTHGSRLGQLLSQGKMDDFYAAVEKDARLRVPAILIARRRGKPKVVRKLLQETKVLPTYCFNKWFAYSRNSKASPRAQDMLLSDYYSLTKQIVQKSPDLHHSSEAMAVLGTLSNNADNQLAQRARHVCSLAQQKGAQTLSSAS